jgi:hypothetical protein
MKYFDPKPLAIDPTDPRYGPVVITNIGVGLGSTIGSYVINTPVIIPAGSLIVVIVSDYGGTGSVLDASGNTYYRGLQLPNNFTWIYYAWNCLPLKINDFIRCIKADSANGSIATAFYATGITFDVDPHDVVVDAVHVAGQTATPTVTSNPASVPNDLFVGVLAWNIGLYSSGFTQPAGWTSPPNPIPAFGIELAGGTRLNAGTDALTYNPVVAAMTASYSAAIIAFTKAVPPPQPPIPSPPTVEEICHPTWPEDRFMTADELTAAARNCSRMRAQSPGERVCVIDTTRLPASPEQNPNVHLHTTAYLMHWRYENVIGNLDPWTYWLTDDEWAAIAPAPPPQPPFPRPPVGWNSTMQVLPGGIPQMDGLLRGMLGFTFVTQTTFVPPSPLVPGGVATRITLTGFFDTVEAYISPVGARPFTVTDFTKLRRLTVNGDTMFTVNGRVVTDPLPYGIDGSSGFLVTAHVSAAPGILGTRSSEPGWESKVKPLGNWTQDLDKSSWADATQDVLSLLMIEGYFGP